MTDFPTIVVVDTIPVSQLRRVLQATDVVLPFGVGVNTPDDVHLEVTMYVVDRDEHLKRPRWGLPRQPSPSDPVSWGAPFIRQVFSFDMSDEALALRQERIIATEGRRPTDAEMDRLMRSEITDDEMAKLILGCVQQAVLHEVREGFYFRGVRLDDPHKT